MTSDKFRSFVAELAVEWSSHYWGDIGGDVIEDMLLKHGLLVQRPATEADCEKEAAIEFDIQPGDPWNVNSFELQAAIDRHNEEKKRSKEDG